MNKIFKIILSILGGTYTVFSIFIPITLVLILQKIYNLTGTTLIILVFGGIFASLYKSIDIFGFENFEYIIKKMKHDR